MNIFGNFAEQMLTLGAALVALPVSALLGAMLAYRPRRHGTPDRDPGVIHAQIILAIVGALVMIVIGDSLARAFGIVGAAGLIRYRARIKDPKDAGVMLLTLGLGLATGVGMYKLAIFATGFLILTLWIVESHTIEKPIRYTLEIRSDRPHEYQSVVEEILTRHKVRHQMVSCSSDTLAYEAFVPVRNGTKELIAEIDGVRRANDDHLTWKRKKAA